MIRCLLLLRTVFKSRLNKTTRGKKKNDTEPAGHRSLCKQTLSQDWGSRLLQQNNYVLSPVQCREKTSARWKKTQNVVGREKKIFEVSIKGTAECHV